jgi:hypothetical protein
LPGLGKPKPGEQLTAADAEQIGDRAGPAVREKDGVHALLEAGAVADEVQTPTRPLPLSAHEWVGQPDRRHQVPPGELGQHPGVDAVGLTGERRQPLHLLGVRDLDPPARQLEPIVHEPCPVHRLDRRSDRRAMTVESSRQAVQPIGIRRCCTNLDRRTLGVEQVKVETLATEIQTGVQHGNGPPLR